MGSKIKFLTGATLIALMTTTSAMAAQQGGVQVGILDQTTFASDSTNLALGSDAKARQAIGAVQDVRAGIVRQVTFSNRAANLAIGSDAAACQTIGTAGKVC